MNTKVCPVCGTDVIINGSKKYPEEILCPNTVTMPNGKIYNHYYYYPGDGHFRIYYLPFKIMGYYKHTDIYYQKKKAGVKPTSPQFKKVLTLPTKKLQFTDGPALIKKLRTLLLFT